MRAEPSQHGPPRLATFVRALIALAVPAAYFGYVFQCPSGAPFSAGLGDWIDPYLINAILEHWRHSLTHLVDPASLPMYFPARGSLGYSVGLILYAPFYTAMRTLLHPFQAWNLTLWLVMVLGSVCLYRIFRRHLALGFVESLLLAAFFFTSGNVINRYANIWAQTTSVFLIPPILLLALWSQRLPAGRLRVTSAAAAGTLTALLFIQDFYTGVFAFLIAGLLGAGALMLAPVRGRLASLWRHDRSWLASAVVGGAVGGGVFLWIYLGAYRERPGFPLEQIMRSLKQLESATWQSAADLWRNLQVFDDLRVFVFVAIATVLVLMPGFELDRRVRLYYGVWFLLVSLVVFIIPLRTSRFSIWMEVFHRLPGLSAIRDPKRIIYAYELAAVLVTGLLWSRLARRSWLRLGLAGVMALLLVTQWNRSVFSFDRPNAAYDRWVAAPITIDPSCRSFFAKGASDVYMSRSGHMWSLYGVDATFIALDHSIPTLNGYTAWEAPDWNLANPQEADYMDSVTQWIARHRLRDVCVFDLDKRTMTPFVPAAE